MPARRIVGHDIDGQPCFQAFDYRLVEPRSDDDEDFYPAVAYSESLSAWRLLDGRWLVHRRIAPLGDDGATTVVSSIEERMPR
jgi:hypothetical protein